MSLRIYGNRLIKTLPGQDTRPTSSRVREAVFNIWQSDIVGCRWLDLCAGSGSMGAEALCRGASLVIGVEQYPRACEIIQQNWEKVAGEDQEWRVLRGSVLQQLQKLRGMQFDKIYFDPPYASKLYQPVLSAIALFELLAPFGEIAAEHSPQNWQPPEIGNWEVCREKVYGNTALTFWRLKGDGENQGVGDGEMVRRGDGETGGK